jgi:hypothetical protein
VAVAGGGGHSLGLKADGTVVAWGSNGGGQCNVPAPNADFVAVAGGGAHSLGVRRSTVTAVEAPGTSGTPPAGLLEIAVVVPNPFNPSATVWFDSERSVNVSLEVYVVGGRRVRTMPLGDLGPGRHWTEWDGRDASGAAMASGVYFLRLRSNAYQSPPMKAILVR